MSKLGQTIVECPGCGLQLPAKEGAVYDGYFNTCAECWIAFGEVVGREFSNPALFGAVHTLTVDAYAVQHAGPPHPDKSVSVHLCGLHWRLVEGRPAGQVPRLMKRMADVPREWPHFKPPADRGALTIGDVLPATEPAQHGESVRAWASEVWRTWSAHHAAIADFARRSPAK
jgi:hypothetical protein